MNRRPCVFVSAGEESGDQHAARMVEWLLRLCPDVRVIGFGGPAMEAAGAELRYPLTDLAVLGFKAVFRNLGRFAALLARFDRILEDEHPDAVVLVDYPGLHVRFAQLARRRGIKVIYYICPQLWAWAPWRARRFRRAVDHALVILPFEEQYHRRHGLEARFVGHPSADRLAGWTPDEGDLALEREIRDHECAIAVMPGSRRQEIAANLPLMLEVVRSLRGSLPALRAWLPQAGRPLARDLCVRGVRDAGAGEFVAVTKRLQPVLRAVRFALVASGTATYEVAYHRVPMVVVYRITPWQQFLGSQLLTVPFVSQVNLVAGREVAPEFVVTGNPIDRIASACAERIRDGEVRERALSALHGELAPFFDPGASRRAAAEVCRALGIERRPDSTNRC